ncbi:MAG: YraN family protein [Nitrospinaceae bacterium]|nr:MAG: YraN family protein [Nitrospinaceae bacterium]
MTRKRKNFGEEGEAAAAAFRRKKGYRILERNFRTNAGEIDLVAEQGRAVVFIEVKSRAGPVYGQPLDALTPAKVNKLRQMAALFLARHGIRDQEVRFDVVSVSGDPAWPGGWRVEVLENAFQD